MRNDARMHPRGHYLFQNEGPTTGQMAKDGWWVRVSLEKQEAPGIVFLVGSSNHNPKPWRIWNTGQPNEFDVPEPYRNVNPLYIKANSTDGKNSWFCVMYRDRGVKHFDFDDDEDHEMNQGDSDDEC